MIYIDLDDAEGRPVFFMGCNDAKVQWIINQILRKGDTVIDIGANHGEHSITSCQLVGPTGFVHTFEPNPKLAEMIRKSFKANNIMNAKIHELALSDMDGKLFLYVDPLCSGAGSLEIDNSSSTEGVVVEARKGDSLFAELGLEKVRLMIVDVEDHEKTLFSGARKFLRNVQPEVILFESREYNVPFLKRAAVKAIESCGEYVFYGIPKTFIRVRVKPISLGKPDTGCHDFLAIHKNCRHELEALLPITENY
ncbi:MAG: FkbM family methyltransferase [Planctomycetota bacterium]|nr:MAG: FkbM family methyltransferase [Planctomycetota bacterium]